MFAALIAVGALIFAAFYLLMVGVAHTQAMRLHRPRCAKCRGERAYGHAGAFPDPDMGTPWIISAVWPVTLIAAVIWVLLIRPTSLASRWAVLAGKRVGGAGKADPERIAEMERELGIR